MFSSNRLKIFFVLLCGSSFFLSCGGRQPEKESETTVPFAAEETKSGIPFSTKEPENFQAEIVVTANGAEDKTFMARHGGGEQRFDYNFGAKNQLAILQTAANQSFLVLPDKKIYAESSASAAAPQTPDNFKDFPNDEWLNSKADAKFSKLGAENNLTKYRITLNDSENSEIIVFVDEKINLPVRQEFYSGSGEQKKLTYAVEIRNFKLQTEDNLFEIPKDFRKVSMDELTAIMRRIKVDE